VVFQIVPYDLVFCFKVGIVGARLELSDLNGCQNKKASFTSRGGANLCAATFFGLYIYPFLFFLLSLCVYLFAELGIVISGVVSSSPRWTICVYYGTLQFARIRFCGFVYQNIDTEPSQVLLPILLVSCPQKHFSDAMHGVASRAFNHAKRLYPTHSGRACRCEIR
jgi:hypothetical protein